MEIKENISLKPYNTFRIDVTARYFVEITSEDELNQLLNNRKFKTMKKFFLGGGSNVLFAKDFEGIVIKMGITGIKVIKENDNNVWLEVGAGHDWHEFVTYCVENEYYGVENLAFIPGTVGAAPVQNIAAYGYVQEDIFESLTAYNVETSTPKNFSKDECEYEYRNSIFKKELKDQYVVAKVTYKLERNIDFRPDESYHSRYETLSDELAKVANEPYDIQDVFNAIISIRKNKLPIVGEVGTVGSFFKNPFIKVSRLRELQRAFPGLQFYPIDKMQYPNNEEMQLSDEEYVKIPVGWLLEDLGWKGKWIGNVGCSEKHSLCIVTNMKASGSEVVEFINTVKKDIKNKCNIDLNSEVVIVD